MATRFYSTSNTGAPANSPGFSAWTRTTEGVRRRMAPTKDGSALTNFSIWANTSPAANASALAVQFQSMPMAVGTAFVTTDTFKAQILVSESATNDNINRVTYSVKVYNGTTLQATLISLTTGPALEWATTNTNRQVTSTTLGANYTTVAGDYLIIEVGGSVDATGGTTVTGTMQFGSSSATDLPEDTTTTAADNCWFELSRTFTVGFEPLTGISSTGAAGTPPPSSAVPTTGSAGTTSAGTVTPSEALALTGSSGTASPGSLTVTPTLTITLKQAGSTIKTWTTLYTGTITDYTLPISAADLATISYPASNLTLTFEAEQLVETLIYEAGLVLPAAAAGPVTVAITGQASTSSAGTVTPSASVALTGSTATGATGTMAGGQSLTGASATAAPGTLTPTPQIPLSGISATSDSGALTPSLTVALAGETATGQTGNVGVSTPGGATLAGTQAIASDGTLTPSTTVALSGVSASGETGTAIARQDITVALAGEQADTATGTVTPHGITPQPRWPQDGGGWYYQSRQALAANDVTVALAGAVGYASTGRVRCRVVTRTRPMRMPVLEPVLAIPRYEPEPAIDYDAEMDAVLELLDLLDD